MDYYDVLVATKNKTDRLLTYASENELEPCQIVKVPLRHQLQTGLVWRRAAANSLSAELKKKCRPVHAASPHFLPKALVKAVSRLGNISALSLSGQAQLLLSNAPFAKPRTTIKAAAGAGRKPPLTAAQAAIYKQIKKAGTGRPQLLLGVNGSGKTRLYAELIEDQLRSGRSALVLVPEIGLSRQTWAMLKDYLGESVYIFHSQLKVSERKALWLRCLNAEKPLAIVGARSAEFLPLANLGLVVLDEFHDDSFRQETWPYYQSIQMASCLAACHNALLVCGSATPTVEDYYRFQKARYPVHYLEQRALPRPTAARIRLVDKRNQKNLFSSEALEAMTDTLRQNNQVLVFYNRRGHWRLAECSHCFWQAECPACDRRLVFHHDKFRLICHGCGASQRPYSVCPKCRQAIHYRQIGLKAVTAKLEQYLAEINLQADVWRFDSDNIRQESLSARLRSIADQPLVLAGTQIIGQGLDLPRLGAVIVLDAEQSLMTPDYRAEEKYYRQIHQLSGRVGRGHLAQTQVVIQSWQPNNETLQDAVRQDWQNFYRREIGNRQRHHLPPFTHLANISIRRRNQQAALAEARQLHRQLCQQFKGVEFYPPAPALREKRSGFWEWLIHARSSRRSDLLAVAAIFKSGEHFFLLDPSQLFGNGS